MRGCALKIGSALQWGFVILFGAHLIIFGL